MYKQEMKDHIIKNYCNIERKILLAHLEYLESGKYYGWIHDGQKMQLINYAGDYEIREYEEPTGNWIFSGKRKVQKSKYYAVNLRRGTVYITPFDRAKEARTAFDGRRNISDIQAVKGSNLQQCTAYENYCWSKAI